jgi:hypothetical protein
VLGTQLEALVSLQSNDLPEFCVAGTPHYSQQSTTRAIMTPFSRISTWGV